MSLSSVSASITGTLAVSSTISASNFSGTSSNTNTGDETNATIKSKLGAATTSVDGYLTATDWNTFNSKQNTLTNPVTGTGTTNYIPKLTGTSTIGNSQIFDNGTNVGIGTTSPSSKLTINGNITANNIFDGFSSITASGTQVVLTINSAPYYLVNGSGGQTIKLPDATTLPNGAVYIFNNNQSSGAITVNNNSNTLVVSIPSGGYANLELIDNTIAAGSWDRHFEAPSNVSWSTNTLDYPGSITSASWNGNAVAVNRGGTGASTASAAKANLSAENILTFSSPLSRTVDTISIPSATTSVSGYLTSTDWNTFNNKVATARSISTTSPLSGGGDLSANRTLSITQSNTSTDGYLSSTDWNTFNGKQSALTNPITGSGTRTANYIPLLSGTNTITNSGFYLQDFDGGTPSRVKGYYIDNINGLYPISLYMGYNGVNGDGEAIYKTSIGEFGLSTTGDVTVGGTISGNSIVSNSGTISGSSLSIFTINMQGSTGNINNANNITGTGKLQIANIGASGTLNVGSTTTATKLVELTTANNTSGAQNNTLRFINNNTTISTNEQIGRIEFYSGDVSSPGASVKAYIACNATSATPAAYIDFATDNLGGATVRQRILADGKVLFGSQTDNGSTNKVQISGGLDYNIETGAYSASSSLLLTHKGRLVTTTSATAINITIQPNSTVAFPIGSQVWIVQEGAGVPTIVAGTGVTLLTRSTLKQPIARYAEIKLTKTATDTWYLTGDLAA